MTGALTSAPSIPPFPTPERAETFMVRWASNLLILALEGKQLLRPFCCVLSASILFGGLLLAWVSL